MFLLTPIRKPLARPPLTTFALLLVVALGAGGCGSKGPLYLPAEPEVQPGFEPSELDASIPGADEEENEGGFGG